MRRVLLVLLGIMLGGCGGGGGGGGGGSVATDGVALDLATQATSVQTVLYAVQLTVRLPAGVTVAADPATGEVVRDRLVVRDTAALASARYTPATAATPGSVVINIADPAGFPPGDLATLLCQDPSGAASGFAVEGFSARNENGATLEGVAPLLSVRRL